MTWFQFKLIACIIVLAPPTIALCVHDYRQKRRVKKLERESIRE